MAKGSKVVHWRDEREGVRGARGREGGKERES